MNSKKQAIITLGSIVLLTTISGPASARFKCWTNHEGVRECGEKVPPEFAQQGHQEMSKQGVVVGKKERRGAPRARRRARPRRAPRREAGAG